jgi:hypothetical protein
LHFGLILAAVPLLLFGAAYLVVSADVSLGNQVLWTGIFLVAGTCAALISTLELLLASTWSLKKHDLMIYVVMPLPYVTIYLFFVTIVFSVAWAVAHVR